MAFEEHDPLIILWVTLLMCGVITLIFSLYTLCGCKKIKEDENVNENVIT